jgi:hypothetical protein
MSDHSEGLGAGPDSSEPDRAFRDGDHSYEVAVSPASSPIRMVAGPTAHDADPAVPAVRVASPARDPVAEHMLCRTTSGDDRDLRCPIRAEGEVGCCWASSMVRVGLLDQELAHAVWVDTIGCEETRKMSPVALLRGG